MSQNGHDPFAAYNMPAAVHGQALKLLDRIAQDELWRAAFCAGPGNGQGAVCDLNSTVAEWRVEHEQ
ncbi:hypothetical protein A3218_11080 [Pseudomonas chlororaphis]|nr:hypothetical protein A3218_11080 [Pseudomonas chlororaphis]